MAEGYIPFEPSGATILVAGDTTAPTGVATSSRGGELCQFRVQNNGSVTAFYAYGTTAGAAQTAAVIPTGGNSRNSYPLGGGQIEVITAPRASFWSAITASSTANVYVTPGRGV